MDAVRAAPSAALERQLATLGDLGPVTLRFDGEAAVEVLIDGRPWRYASRGRLVYADLCFRAALRRAVGLGALPLILDDRTAWSGDLPATVLGPIWVLTTARVERLHVVGTARAAA